MSNSLSLPYVIIQSKLLFTSSALKKKIFEGIIILLIILNIQVEFSQLVPFYPFPLKSTLLPQHTQKIVHNMVTSDT